MAPAAGVKKQKKKWSKGKVKDKAQHSVILEDAAYDKIKDSMQAYRVITVSVLVDRMKINGSLARRMLKEQEAKGTIKKVVSHHCGNIYTRAVGGGEKEKEDKAATDDK